MSFLAVLQGSAHRTAGEGVHKVRALQQRERAEIEGVQRENGPRERLELPHFPLEREEQVRRSYTTHPSHCMLNINGWDYFVNCTLVVRALHGTGGLCSNAA